MSGTGTRVHTRAEDNYLRIRQNRNLALMVWLSRYLIGFAFIPSGMKKVLGLRFTSLGVDTPIGFFFEALYQSGVYWYFLGIGQVLASLLMMTQRFATIGTLIFTFIIANVWMITVSLHFGGTWVITTLLFFGCICLLLWDYNKLQFLFYRDNFEVNKKYQDLPEPSSTWVISGFILFCLSVVWSVVSSNMVDTRYATRYALIFVILILIIVLFTVVSEFRGRKKVVSRLV